MNVRLVGSVVIAVLLASSGAFLVQPSTAEIEPVAFEDTIAVGMNGVDVRAAEERGVVIPRAQVFYGQYQYVIGYYGIEALVDHVQSGAARRQFGPPLAIFVSDFSDTEPTLTDAGYIDLGNSRKLDHVRGRDAWFVVGSRARTTAGPAILPFADRADAASFVEKYGGRILDWDALTAAVGDRSGNTLQSFRAAVENLSAWADRQVTRRQHLRSRPVSVVVGEDAPTLAAALAAAPPNTTVALPPGRYDGNVTVDKPLTLRGSGAETIVDGGGNGTVLTVRSDRVAITSLRVVGVGPTDSRSPQAGNLSRWTDRTMLVYGRSDAGILFAGSNESLVADVRIDTSATGVLLRHSDRTVVRNVTIQGEPDPAEGSMGVIPMYSRVVIEESSVRGGRDGVYTHHADGSVIRDNDVAETRYAVHEMFTSSLLIRNNTLTHSDAGIILMTRPANNLLVGNRAINNDVGLVTIGGTSFVAGNVVVDNHEGINLGTTRSVYVNNTVVHNEVGIRIGTLLPTNHVVSNDVVDNGKPLVDRAGPVHVWTAEGNGNYWGQVPGLDRDGDGRIDRPFRPGSRIDVVASRAAGGPTLARAPALELLQQVAGSVPGLREAGVIDTAPRTRPARPAVLEEVRNGTDD